MELASDVRKRRDKGILTNDGRSEVFLDRIVFRGVAEPGFRKVIKIVRYARCQITTSTYFDRDVKFRLRKALDFRTTSPPQWHRNWVTSTPAYSGEIYEAARRNS